MNKTAIKNFATWARNKLIADITYKAGLMGITEKSIADPQPQSTGDMQFFDIGMAIPYTISGDEIVQRRKLVEIIRDKARLSEYTTAFKSVVEEVAYTWFNRLIAVRFMEVNDYLPSRIRVLSSESPGKSEPDLVTSPFDGDLSFSEKENEQIFVMKRDNKLDELFRMLFVKQCNALNAILPELFEKTSDYTELLLNIAYTDKEGVVSHLVNDIAESDFNINQEGQVEIIGWLYQYYNTEPKQEVFDLLKKNVKITKERIPAATQLFTPDWIVRYMVENSLGRLWLERHPNEELKSHWKYYIEEAEQDPAVAEQLSKIRSETHIDSPEDITFIDPCMGSGHILVYAFDVLMQIYESCGYSARDAATKIIEKNLHGYDIDLRAYQLSYFALAMKARQYNRRAFSQRFMAHVFHSNDVNMIQPQDIRRLNSEDAEQTFALFADEQTYGSLIKIPADIDLEALTELVQKDLPNNHQLSLDDMSFKQSTAGFLSIINTAKLLRRKYDVVCTNPPYMGGSGMNGKLNDFVKNEYPDSKSDLFAAFIERCREMTKVSAYFAMITQHAWMFLSSFEKLRGKLSAVDTISMAHLGARAFAEIGGEVVQSSAFVMRTGHIVNFTGTYVRLIDFPNAEQKEKEFLSGNHRYTARAENFTKIPGIPVAYWVSERIVECLATETKIIKFGKALSGLSTSNNEKFLRLWHEVRTEKIHYNYHSCEDTEDGIYKWIPHNKGGGFRRWYGNLEFLVNWESNGRDIKLAVVNNPTDPNTTHWSRRIFNHAFFFKSGVTWSDISTGNLSARLLPTGTIPNATGPTLFISDESNMEFFLGYLNSKVFQAFLDLVCQGIHFNTGAINQLPVFFETPKQIDAFVSDNIVLSRTDWDSFETSWDFTRHPLRKFGISMPGLTDSCNLHKLPSPFMKIVKIDDSYFIRMADQENNYQMDTSFEKYKMWTEDQFLQLKANEEELNRIFIDIYGLQDELTPEVVDKDVTVARIYDSKEDIPESMKGNNYVLTKADVVKSFISYAVGCMFGRYSLDVDGLAYAGGDWDNSKYSSFIPDKNNILPLTDEEYYDDDVVGLLVHFVKVVYGKENLEENLEFIAETLGTKGNSSREMIRSYFLKDFFKDHCKTYKKRPIYWLFDSGKTDGFKALIYMHRYDENTIGNLRIDYLHRIQRVYDSEIARMQETIENSSNDREIATAEKRKEKLIKQLKETKDYDAKIAHLALARIAIDLDDGVKVNYEKVQTGTDGKKLDILAKI